jgi:hypothetical protein
LANKGKVENSQKPWSYILETYISYI